MVDKNKFQEILNDLYALDASLREREKELVPLLEKLIKAKPQTVFSETFAAELKQQLLAKTPEFGKNNNMKKEKTNLFKIDWKIMSYASVGTAALVLVAVAGSSMMIYKQNSLSLGKKVPTTKNQIVKVSRNAFGTLTLAKNTNAGNLEAMSKSNNASLAAPTTAPAVDNGFTSERASAAPLGMGGGGAVSGKMMADSSIMPPRQGSVKYVYSGDDFELSTGPASVYKKLPPNVSNFDPVVSAINGLNVDSVDISHLKDLKLDSLSIKEDRDFGYSLNLSPSSNVFYMSKNWEKWPNPGAKCQDDKCWQDVRLKLSDMISDDEALQIAKDFVSEYKINTNGYGQPFVQNSWKTSYDGSTDKENYYFPEEVSVVYPLMIEGGEVRGQGGEALGLMVGVDVRSHKATGFNGTIAPSFESSEYDVIADKAEVIKLAESGGMNGQYYYYAPEGEKELVVELGTPRKILMVNWKYDQQSGQGYELYLPAYIFPVKNKPENNFYVESIVVPLVKEAYDNINYPILMKSGGATEPAAVSAPTPLFDVQAVKPE